MTFKLSNADEKSMDGKTYGKLKLIFNGLVHETVSYYSYDGLSFIYILPVACDVTNSSVVSDFDSDFALTMK